MAKNKIRDRLCITQAHYGALMGMERSHFAHSEKGKKSMSETAWQRQTLLDNLLKAKDEQNAPASSNELSHSEILKIGEILRKDYNMAKYRFLANERRLTSMRRRYPAYELAVDDMKWLIQQEEIKNHGLLEWVEGQLHKLTEKMERAHPKNQMLAEVQIAAWKAACAKSRQIIEAWVAAHGAEGFDDLEKLW